MMSKGSLILVCRSDQLEHFSWFARRLHDQLLAEGQTDITIIQVTSSAQLQDALLACPAPHDVADIHIFGEFKVSNFFKLKKAMDEINFNFEDIKNLYFFQSGRWDIETNSGILIKLPKEKIKDSLQIFIDIIWIARRSLSISSG